MTNIIEVEDLFYTYRDGTRALDGVTLSVREGARTVLLGPNGAGKSTLLLHLNGIFLAQKGTVRVAGRKIDQKSEKWVRTVVGLVFQDPDDQVFSSTVWDDVAFGPKNMGLSGAEIERRVAAALEAVKMGDYRDRAPYRLSYGEKRRVAIAGVLAMSPRVIVLDEPLACLDPQGRDGLLEVLNRLNEGGTTVIVATHDVDFAAQWADQVLVIKDGKTLARGDTSLLADERLIREARLNLPVITRLFKKIPGLVTGKTPLTVDDAVVEMNRLLSGSKAE
ncbi:MAG TPA: ATP-binding cassette domain-containing protein [Bacillota bacterium]|nr:ATP-binding cassette domain-containing protein [Bacillota bacterium]